MPDIPLDGVDPTDVDHRSLPFAKMVAVIAALVVLLGSIVALLEQRAGGEAERAAVKAQGLALENARLLTKGNLDVWAGLRRDADHQVLMTRAFDAWHAGDDDQAAALAATADDLVTATPFLREPALVDDPYRPARFVADAFAPYLATDASRRATLETSAVWDQRAAAYTAILTELAAVLFLLGLSLITRVGRLAFLGTGVFLAVTGLVLTVRVSTSDVRGPSEESLRALVEGGRLAGSGDYDGAVDAYTRAIDLSGGYHRAYLARAASLWLGDAGVNPLDAYVARIDGPELKLALADVRSARDRGSKTDPTASNALAALLLHDGDFAGAETILVDLLHDDPNFPVALSNLGAARAGLQDESGAAEAYQSMLSTANAELARAQRDQLYATARTVLKEIASRSPEQLAVATRMATLVTAGQLTQEQGQGAPGAASAGSVAPGAASVRQNGSFLTVDLVSTLPADTPVAYVWYQREVGRSLWVQPAAMVTAGRSQGKGADSGSVAMGPCPVPGDYHVDVVANGALVSSADFTVPSVSSDHYVVEVNLAAAAAVCRPADWQRIEGGDRELAVARADGSASIHISASRIEGGGAGLKARAEKDVFLDQFIRGQFDRPLKSTGAPAAATVGGLTGRAQTGTARDGTKLYIFAAVDEGIVRSVVMRYPPEATPTVAAAVNTVAFLWTGLP